MQFKLFINIIFISFFLFSCGKKELHSVQQFTNEIYDSIKYYKDIDHITFDGLGIPSIKPFEEYPYSAIAFKKETPELYIFFSDTKQAKIKLKKFLNNMYYYATTYYYDGLTMGDFTIFDKNNKRQINFWGRKETVLKGDISEVTYYSKNGSNYETEIYQFHINEEKIPWQKITILDTNYLKLNFCMLLRYSNEFSNKTITEISSDKYFYCSSSDSNEKSLEKSNPIIVKFPSIFYFKVYDLLKSKPSPLIEIYKN